MLLLPLLLLLLLLLLAPAALVLTRLAGGSEDFDFEDPPLDPPTPSSFCGTASRYLRNDGEVGGQKELMSRMR